MKKFILKHIQIIALAVLMLISAVSCHRGTTTDIVNRSDNFYQRVQYRGQVIFNLDKTAIDKISDGGYLKFTRNDRSLEAEPEHDGRIAYKFDGDDKINELNADQKQFLAEAVKAIIDQRNKMRRDK